MPGGYCGRRVLWEEGTVRGGSLRWHGVGAGGGIGMGSAGGRGVPACARAACAPVRGCPLCFMLVPPGGGGEQHRPIPSTLLLYTSPHHQTLDCAPVNPYFKPNIQTHTPPHFSGTAGLPRTQAGRHLCLCAARARRRAATAAAGRRARSRWAGRGGGCWGGRRSLTSHPACALALCNGDFNASRPRIHTSPSPSAFDCAPVPCLPAPLQFDSDMLSPWCLPVHLAYRHQPCSAVPPCHGASLQTSQPWTCWPSFPSGTLCKQTRRCRPPTYMQWEWPSSRCGSRWGRAGGRWSVRVHQWGPRRGVAALGVVDVAPLCCPQARAV